MPSSATITSFYNFTANTRARATQVNNNFDAFRGHLVPIEPLTATSSDISYDLGSDEHRWRTSYVKTIDFDRSTSTASATIEADANTGTGEIVCKVNGSEAFRVITGGYTGKNYKTYGTTATAAVGQIAQSGVPSIYGSTSTYTTVPNSTLTISTIGRPVVFGTRTFANTVTGFYLNASGTYNIAVYRNGTPVYIASIGETGNFPPSSIHFIDFQCPSGSNVYQLYYRTPASVGYELGISNFYLSAWEL